ncbi:MAG TPA: FemAB family PEP-CTERM system-associated protein [Gammaproteobacteria bacterium]|nr:FemAB family PEP-CTERM system-associated protein [Gammaproteobacteria bacterium]
MDTRQAIEIKTLDDAAHPRWDAFVAAFPDATFFHRAGWKTVLERAFGHEAPFLYAERAGRIIGVLPLGRIKSAVFGHALISTPFCVYGGAAAVEPDAIHALEQAACELAAGQGVDYLELRHIVPRHPDWPRKEELYVTFRKALDPDPDKNLLAIPRKQRAMVRKGIQAGLRSDVDDGVERVYEAYSISVRNLGTPVFSKAYFQTLKDVFGDDCECLVVSRGGRLVAGVMNFYFRDQVLPYYGGGTDEARAVKGNDFMYWEVMRRAVLRGVRVFDYGRSKVGTGSYSFKKNWGFEPAPLVYEYQLVKAREVPDINPLNPKYRLFINTWKRLPLGLTRLLGPHIVKYLG